MNNKLKNNSGKLNTSPEESSSEKENEKSGGLSMLARVSTLSWDLVVPIVGGVLLGAYIDKVTGNDLQWTLSLLVLGIIIAFANLYNLYMDHQSSIDGKQNNSPDNEVSDEKDK